MVNEAKYIVIATIKNVKLTVLGDKLPPEKPQTSNLLIEDKIKSPDDLLKQLQDEVLESLMINNVDSCLYLISLSSFWIKNMKIMKRTSLKSSKVV